MSKRPSGMVVKGGAYLGLCCYLLLCLGTLPRVAAAEIPAAIQDFTSNYCVSCHGTEKTEGDFRIDTLDWDLTGASSREQWDLIVEYVSEGDMPPKKAKRHPEPDRRQRFLEALRREISHAANHAAVGGTPVRRLNRVEYLNTVRELFRFRMINLPLSFPEDATRAEFDTMPEGLVLSPAVLEGYHDVATDIADRFVPLPDPPRYRSSFGVLEIGGDATRRWFDREKEYLMFTGFNNSGWTGALWDSLFVAPSSGTYRVRLLANAQSRAGADGEPLRLSFYAFDPTEEQLPKRYRLERATLVAEVDVPVGQPRWIECDVPVEAGETFHVYCSNRFPEDHFPEGDLNRSEINQLVKQAKKEPLPTVELRGLEVDGPIDIPPRVSAFFGTWPPELDAAALEAKLLPLATRAFRRPLTASEREHLVASVLAHREEGLGSEYVWHHAIRRLLCSPNFLYREVEEPGALSGFALASRLSYFLWSGMPDQELLELAGAGELTNPKVLAAETRRLIDDPRAQEFVKHFSGQWLGNRTVASINVCDNRYQWDDNVRYGYIRSTEMFFAEVLRENLPIRTFVDSDFSYANSAMRAVWGMKGGEKLGAVAARQRQSLVWPEPTRLDLNRLSADAPGHLRVRGGVLGLPGVLTVTGDGVESSPILRGVWILENLFGEHPPPPPKDVPALDIDTSQARSVRETLKRHTEIESCARCHRRIDPLGLAMENFDAVGGWRESYSRNGGDLIDSEVTMPSGVRLYGAASIKKHLLENREIFTRCLLTKILEYGAGRSLSLGDQRIVEELVALEPDEGYRFRDLIVAAVTSDVFLNK